jgi:hypothetical protein
MQAGDNIGGCTVAFGAWDNGPWIRGKGTRRDFALAAGHCNTLGETVWRGPALESRVGVVKRNQYDEHIDFTTDAEAIRLDDPNIVPKRIFMDSFYAPRIGQPISTYEGQIACQSGVASSEFTSREVRCGPVLTNGAAVEMSHRRSDRTGNVKTMQIPSSAGVIHGDSGGPVWDFVTQRPLGIITGAAHGSEYRLGNCIILNDDQSNCPILGITPLLSLPNVVGVLDRLGLHLHKDE